MGQPYWLLLGLLQHCVRPYLIDFVTPRLLCETSDMEGGKWLSYHLQVIC